jgi:hypothetical protein
MREPNWYWFTFNRLECGDLSLLWSLPVRASRIRIRCARRAVEPPQAKAVTGHRTPKRSPFLKVNVGDHFIVCWFSREF